MQYLKSKNCVSFQANWYCNYVDTDHTIILLKMAGKFLGSTYFLLAPATNNWASPLQNLSSEVCEQQRPRPACASAQPDQRLCYSLTGRVISKLASSEI